MLISRYDNIHGDEDFVECYSDVCGERCNCADEMENERHNWEELMADEMKLNGEFDFNDNK